MAHKIFDSGMNASETIGFNYLIINNKGTI